MKLQHVSATSVKYKLLFVSKHILFLFYFVIIILICSSRICLFANFFLNVST